MLKRWRRPKADSAVGPAPGFDGGAGAGAAVGAASASDRGPDFGADLAADAQAAAHAAAGAGTGLGAHSAKPPQAKRLGGHSWLQRTPKLIFMVALLALVLAMAALWTSLRNERASLWLLNRVPGLVLTSPSGALLGPQFSAAKLRYEWAQGRAWLELDGIALQGMVWRAGVAPGQWLQLKADSLRIERAVFKPDNTGTEPAQAPSSLRLPFELEVQRLEVGQLHLQTDPASTAQTAPGAAPTPPLRDLSARLHLGSERGARHRIDALQFAWDRLQAQGSFNIQADTPFAVQAQAAVHNGPNAANGAPAVPESPSASASASAAAAKAAKLTAPDPARGNGVANTLLAQWSAQLQASGPLAALETRTRLRGSALPGREPPSLDAQVQLRPFAAWPLGALDAQTKQLDLQSLVSAWPATRLDINAHATRADGQAPFNAEFTLDNSQPGRWSAGHLPLRQARLQLRASTQNPERLEIPAFDLEFAQGPTAAGRWQGQGVWLMNTLQLDTRLTEVRPQQLDERAAAMRLSGPLNLVLRGLPRPDQWTKAEASAPARPGGSGRSAGAGAAGGAGAAATAGNASGTGLSAELRGQWSGTLDAAPETVKFSFDALASRQGVVLRSLQAQAGGASAELSGELRALPPASVNSAQRWQLLSQGRLQDFDPLPWFAGPPDSAWRRGPHRLSAHWTLDLALPQSAAALPPLQWLQTLQGNGELQIDEGSRLAGVPLSGQLKLQHEALAAAGARSQAQGELRLGRNRLTLEGRGDPLGAGAQDNWQVQFQAPALAEFAPLMALEPRLAAWLPRQGGAEGQARIEGRWPRIKTQGELRVTALQAGALSLGRGQIDWRMTDLLGVPSAPEVASGSGSGSGFSSGSGSGLALQLNLDQAQYDSQRLDSLRGELRGSLAQHRLNLSLVTPVAAPEILARTLGLPQTGGTQARLVGEGAWLPNSEGGGVWRGLVERLSVGVAAGAAPGTRRVASVSASVSASAIASASASLAEPLAGADASWFDTRDWRGELRLDGQGRVVAGQAAAGRAALAGGLNLRWSEVRWRADAAQNELSLQADIDPVAVAPWLQRLQPSTSNITWSGDLRVSAKLDLRAGERFDADLKLQRSSGDLAVSDGGSPQALGLTDLDFAISAHDGLWRFTPVLAGRLLGTVTGNIVAKTQAQRRWPPSDAALEGAVTAQVPNLGVWAAWAPPGWRIEGELASTARVGGRFGAPSYTGELRAERIGLRNLLQGIAVSDGSLQMALDGDSARIERMSLRAGDGLLTGEGRATFGATPQAQLSVKAERFRVLGRVDRQLVVSGQTSLNLQPERLRLTGQLMVDSGLFDLTARDAPNLDDDVTVRMEGAQEDRRPEATALSPLMRNAQVALDLDLGQKLRLRGRGLDTLLGGTLKITAPGGRLAINGAVRAEQGTYAAYGQKLTIDRGVVGFSGTPDSARLDILALRPNLDVRVGVAITGTALNPRVRLVSEPEMSETDKLSWLVLGRGPDGLGRTDTALLQRAAVALLAGEGEGPTDALVRAIGLDEVSLRQTDGEVRDTVISLGKQLSRRWYVGYERGVNATAGTWQLIYRAAQRFTLRAQSGLDNSLDLIWTWRFDDWFGGPKTLVLNPAAGGVPAAVPASAPPSSAPAASAPR